ncbi:MAG: hypothetical protein A2V66_03645 [Ignavibacteria bacterium RBG_13_36_8]|nr:MAG: hypothetical protein A2V66_03645 [Ignavibacteria bacterium RBG_13_36_8]
MLFCAIDRQIILRYLNNPIKKNENIIVQRYKLAKASKQLNRAFHAISLLGFKAEDVIESINNFHKELRKCKI